MIESHKHVEHDNFENFMKSFKNIYYIFCRDTKLLGSG